LPEITDKPYLGFTPLPYDLPTEPGVEPITYGFLTYHGTLIFHYCHSGLDPWFDRLTTLSQVEGESSIF
jgi:hypothetical protein